MRPGCAVNAAALYKLPAAAMFSINQSAVALGLAQASFDAYIEQARTRIARMSGRSVSDYSTVQVKVGESRTAIKMARMLLHDCCDLGMAVAEKGEVAPMELKTELRAKAAMAGKPLRPGGRSPVPSLRRGWGLRPEPDLGGRCGT